MILIGGYIYIYMYGKENMVQRDRQTDKTPLVSHFFGFFGEGVCERARKDKDKDKG